MKCFNCGEEMIPATFNMDLDGSPSMEGFPSYEAGQLSSENELWIQCPDWHRGTWIKPDEQ